MKEHKALSQTDIDALLAGYQGEEPSVPPSGAARSGPVAVARSGGADGPVAIVTGGERKVAAPPAAKRRPAQPTKTPPTNQHELARLSARVQELEARLAAAARLERLVGQLQRQLASLSSAVHRSFGSSARQGFVCASCGTPATVAAKVQCTTCGQDSLWGWWPQPDASTEVSAARRPRRHAPSSGGRGRAAPTSTRRP